MSDLHHEIAAICECSGEVADTIVSICMDAVIEKISNSVYIDDIPSGSDRIMVKRGLYKEIESLKEE